MPHPATYYIRSLIYRGYENHQISEELNRLGIMAPGDQVYARIRAGMGTIVGDAQRVASGDGPSIAYLHRKSIYVAFHDLPCMELIQEAILCNPSLRSLCERSLLAKLDFEALEELVEEELQKQNKSDIRLTQRMLRLYKHYYWNVDLLSTAEMLEYLHKVGDPWHVESLYGGRDHLLYRTGKKKIEISPDEAHLDLMMRMFVRASFVDSLPITESSDMRITHLTKAFSTMWKNSKSAGSADMQKAYEELRKVTERRRNPKEDDVSSNEIEPLLDGDEDEDDDTDL